MFRIDLPHLCWAMENLVAGKVVNEIRVDPQTRKWATVALQRMLEIAGGRNSGGRAALAATVD
jgi:quinolinate synthase